MITVIVVSTTMVCFLIIGIALVAEYVDIGVFGQSTINVNLEQGQGQVLGSLETTLWTNENYWQFLSIPYAESPKGDLRFKAPTPRKPWKNIHDGTKFGLRCPVITTVQNMPEQEINNIDLEDCLNLCVYTKSISASQPVMFYIYGGGFYNGSASDHPPKHLLAQHQDIVLVVAQYRIGALGWLTTFTDDMPGNAPVADLILALNWVQTHIHKFGGDAKRVTIVGQSAGAGMAGTLMITPLTAKQQLFRAALLQSGSILSSWAIRKDTTSQVQRICNALKCGECSTPEGMHACLQTASVVDILAVTTTDKESFGPVVGDLLNVMPKQPKALLDELTRPLPVMTGFTKHDGSFALATFYDTLKAQIGNFSLMTVRQFTERLISTLSTDNGLSSNLCLRLLFDKTPGLLDSVDHKQAIPAYFDIVNTLGFKSDIINFAKTMALKKLANSYLYSFDYAGEHTRFGYEFGNDQYPFEGGVHHSNDNIYVFSTHQLNEADTEMAKKIVALWTSFVIDGVPKGLSDDALISSMSTEKGPYFHISKIITTGEDALKELTVTIDDPQKDKLIRPNKEF